ncbi:MAG: DNA-directed RNA polymerase subunit beta' [Patescibacteria group bacterium]
MLKVSDFKAIKLALASPEEILGWSHGEVTKSETINYRTQRAEKDGLFCEKIFGPEKDWECYCGKYKKIRYKGIVCDKCGVEVTRSIVRRERMGHIKLATPVAHVWFLRGVPSKIGTLLDIPLHQLEKVAYFASYIITEVNEELKGQKLEELAKEYTAKIKQETDIQKKEAFKAAYDTALSELKSLKPIQILSENEYYEMSLKYGEMFKAGIGAEAIKNIAASLDLHKLEKELEIELRKDEQSALKPKLLKRYKLAHGFARAGIKPEWMFLTALPIMPPDLRPMVQLDGGRYASSDLNDLYRRIINRNNRLKKLLDLNAPEVIVRNEKRMLQEAVDALIDNSARKGKAVMAATGQKRQLRSLADMLKGKSGRFRQNLLGKRVDYSGRSVIVVGPEMRLDQCGLPKKMALELFKPFVIQKIIERELAHNIKGAGYLIEEASDVVWEILEEVIQGKCVLLNRAPTLHRLGIQAFYPVLIEGMAIRIHPLVCSAFNADFDGDQMAVHLPITEEAQAEAREIMLSAKNLLKPASGDPITVPTQDIVLGCYFLTAIKEGAKGEGKIFSSKNEAVLAYDFGVVAINAKVKVFIKEKDQREHENEPHVETSVGRIIFNWALGTATKKFVNREFAKKDLEALVADVIDQFGVNASVPVLDIMKKLGFEYATKSGISWGMADLNVPVEKEAVIERSNKEVKEIGSQYQNGLLTDDERYTKVVQVWNRAKIEVGKTVPAALVKHGSVYSILRSRARGSEAQLIQMAGMKGPVVNPSGEIIELPIKKSYKEGLGILEYFISTHGARKGTADTALRTASAGYLTRKLVDVVQDVIVKEEDCGDTKGVTLHLADADAVGQDFSGKTFGRYLLEDVKEGDTVIAQAGEIVTRQLADLMDEKKIKEVKVRSVLACKTKDGACQKCYGYDLGINKVVRMGSPVGVVAAQAIGEPGTQLTMRTFHIGGVAGGGDITMGLPRVEEIFEARTPKGKALLCEVDGKVLDIITDGEIKRILVESTEPVVAEKEESSKDEKTAKKKEEREIKEYQAPHFTTLWVEKGKEVRKGMQLSEGHLDLGELLRVSGIREVERYIISEVQKIYTSEGASISDKHIEVIVRKMFSRVRVKEAGDTNLVRGDIVEKTTFFGANKEVTEGQKKATAAQVLLGITRCALTTESFLSAASFQETTRVLINAAVQGKTDRLRGLKENVIIGKLIPAGTGYAPLQGRPEGE